MFKKIGLCAALVSAIFFFISCESNEVWTGLYGAQGYIYDHDTTNAIPGLMTILFNSAIAVTNTTGTNGFYSGFVYISGTKTGIYNSDRTNDFNLTITDIDGVSNGSYPALTTNIGPVYKRQPVLDFYLMTN
jgi:hypothetical protein